MISVLVSTYNGERTIGRFLLAISECEASGFDWELVVVNNASTDKTEEVIKTFFEKIPLKLLRYDIRGKNRALNYGLEHAMGDLLVFTDDYVLPNRDWLVSIKRRADCHVDVDLFGGPILPCWEEEPPLWLESSVPLGIAFALTSPDLKDGPVDPRRIWGPNMFVRRTVFDNGIKFNESVGPAPGQYVMGSETDFTSRAAAAGHLTWWCPDVQVRHIIKAEQVRRDWLLKRAYRYGKTSFLLERQGTLVNKSILDVFFSRKAFILRQIVLSAMRGVMCDLLGREDVALRNWWRFWQLCGYINQGTLGL